MASIKQEMPPPGGYGPVDMAKKIGKKSPYFWMGILGGYMVSFWAGRHYWLNIRKKRLNYIEREMIDARIALSPLIQAEKDRLFLKQLRANRDEETELMKDVPDWKVGTLWGKPVYNNARGKFNAPHNYEFYAHAHPDKALKRGFEKLWH